MLQDGRATVVEQSDCLLGLFSGQNRCSNVGMKDGEKLEAFVEATLDDTLAGYEAFLPPHVLASIRGSLRDDFVAHPVMRVLVREQAPIETPKAFTDEGVNPEALADEKKDHG